MTFVSPGTQGPKSPKPTRQEDQKDQKKPNPRLKSLQRQVDQLNHQIEKENKREGFTVRDVGPKSERFTGPEQYRVLNKAVEVIERHGPEESRAGFNLNFKNDWGDVFFTIAFNKNKGKDAQDAWDMALVEYDRFKSDRHRATLFLETRLKDYDKKMLTKPVPKEELFVTPQKPAPEVVESPFLKSVAARLKGISSQLHDINPAIARSIDAIVETLPRGPLIQERHRLERRPPSREPHEVVPQKGTPFAHPEDDVTLILPDGSEMVVKMKELIQKGIIKGK